MNNIELRVAREALGFSVADAARLIGNVEQRSWRRWESGEASIPNDVIDIVEDLIEWREDLSATITDTINEVEDIEGSMGEIEIPYYTSEQSFIEHSRFDRRIYYRPYTTVVYENFLLHYPNCVLLVL